jgi:adenylate kinase family enzyme
MTERVVVIGNAGGGKSTLARKLAAKRDLPCIEIDALLWQPGWQLTEESVYQAEHARLIARDRWLMDGFGWLNSMANRLERATEIIFVDMPLWMHFWLLAERQIAWAKGELTHPPAGIRDYVTTEDMFRTFWEVERDEMPAVRCLVDAEERRGKKVIRIASVDGLNQFSAKL